MLLVSALDELVGLNEVSRGVKVSSTMLSSFSFPAVGSVKIVTPMLERE